MCDPQAEAPEAGPRLHVRGGALSPRLRPHLGMWTREEETGQIHGARTNLEPLCAACARQWKPRPPCGPGSRLCG